MHDDVSPSRMHHRLMRVANRAIVAIGRGEHRIERVVAARAAEALGDREQMQVVIAEHRPRARAKPAHKPQHFE